MIVGSDKHVEGFTMARLSSAAQRTISQILTLIEQRESGAISWRGRDKKLKPLIDQIARSGIDPDRLVDYVPGWIIRNIRWAKTSGRHKV